MDYALTVFMTLLLGVIAYAITTFIIWLCLFIANWIGSVRNRYELYRNVPMPPANERRRIVILLAVLFVTLWLALYSYFIKCESPINPMS